MPPPRIPQRIGIPNLPMAPGNEQVPRAPFDNAVKANLERITGRNGPPLTLLSDSATLAEVISAVNIIIARLQ